MADDTKVFSLSGMLVDNGPVGQLIAKLEGQCRVERSRCPCKDWQDVQDMDVPEDDFVVEEAMRRLRILGWRIEFYEFTVAGAGRAGVFSMTPPRNWK